MKEAKFELGEVLKDRITGFKGVAMARTQYFTECDHYGLCPQKLENGKPSDWEWFDDTRLDRVTGSKKIVLGDRKKPSSGKFPAPPQI